jgi:hypothetical protein
VRRDPELVVVGRDPLGKRIAVRCSACGRAFVIAAGATPHCGCAPLSADRRDALRAEARDLDLRREMGDWRPRR